MKMGLKLRRGKWRVSAGGRRTCDGVAEEEAVGAADPVAEGLDGGREPAVGRLEVGVEQRQVGDVDVLHAQPRDGLLAHLRRGCMRPCGGSRRRRPLGGRAAPPRRPPSPCCFLPCRARVVGRGRSSRRRVAARGLAGGCARVGCARGRSSRRLWIEIQIESGGRGGRWWRRGCESGEL